VGEQSGAVEYSPVTLNFTSGTFNAPAYVSVSLENFRHPNNAEAHYINRYWTVTQSNITGFSCEATFQYISADISGSESLLRGMKYEGASWIVDGTVDTLNHRFSFNGLSSFSDFTAGSAAAPDWLIFLPLVSNQP
jgi:hypothetical protein